MAYITTPSDSSTSSLASNISYLNPEYLPFSYASFQAMFEGTSLTDYLQSITILDNLPRKAQKKVLSSLVPHFKHMPSRLFKQCYGDAYYTYCFHQDDTSSFSWSENRHHISRNSEFDVSLSKLAFGDKLLSFVMHILGETEPINAFSYINNTLNIVKQPLTELRKRLFPDTIYLRNPSPYLPHPNPKKSWAFNLTYNEKLRTNASPFRNSSSIENYDSRKTYIEVSDFLFVREYKPKNCYVSTYRYGNEIAHILYTLYYDTSADMACWTIFPPETDLIYNKASIEQEYIKRINIYDHIADTQRPSKHDQINTWLGFEADYPDVDWSFSEGKEINYFFDESSKKSVEHAILLHNSLSKSNKKLTLVLKERKIQNPPAHLVREGYDIKSLQRPISFHDLLILAKEKHNICETNSERSVNSVKSRLTVKTVDKLNKDPVEKNFLVKPLFKPGEIALLVAKQKSGKSFFALDLSIMLATGGNIGNRLKAPTPQKVLVVDAEMPEAEVVGRINYLKKNYEFDRHKDNLNFVFLRENGTKLNLINQDDQNQLENIIDKQKLLVLDNLGKLIARKGETNEHQWNSFFNWLRKLTQKGITVLLVHHENKTGQHRGTGKMTDDVDLVISLKNSGDSSGTYIDVNIDDARFLYSNDCQPFTIVYDNSNQRKVITNPKTKEIPKVITSDLPTLTLCNTKQVKELTKSYRDILRAVMHSFFIDKKISVATRYFVRSKSGRSRSTVSNALAKFCENGWLRKEGTDKTTEYFLTEKGRSLLEDPPANNINTN